MKNLFIVASSFIAKKFLFQIEFVLDLKFSNIFLMEENHTMSEFKKKNNIYLVNLDEGIDKADIILLFQDQKIPHKTISYLSKRSEELKKRVVRIDVEANCPNAKDCALDVNVPRILNIAIGCGSQQYCAEILLNKIFWNKNIRFKQIFSPTTFTLLSEIYNARMLNHSIKKHLLDDIKDFDIEIVSKTFENFEDFFAEDVINELNPDFVVLNTDQRFNNHLELLNLFKFKYGIPLYIINSRYIDFYRTAVDKIFVYCQSTYNKNFKSFEDEILIKDLEEHIFCSLALPDNILILK